MRYSNFSWTILALFLALNLLSSEAYEAQRERGGRYYSNHHHHGGHRRQRETHVYGNGIKVHHESDDGSAVSTSSSSSSITTTSEEEPSGVAGTYRLHIPGRTVYESTGHLNSLSATATSRASLSLGSAEAFTPVLQPAVVELPTPSQRFSFELPTPIVRPAGDLPFPPHRFGFEALPGRVDAGAALPNCGCLQNCAGEVGLYTRQVLPYSELVCGVEFKTCCFDGPYPGSHDLFADQAACVPRELCLRPYGVLPTDVRDFGVIGPCPGFGAVRCIAVDSVGLLEFRAALSAIEASSVSGYRREYHVSPMHLVLPLLKNGGKTSVEAESTASIKLDGFFNRPQPQPIYIDTSGKGGKTTIVRTETTDDGTTVKVTGPFDHSFDQPPKTIVVQIPPKPILVQPPPAPAPLPAPLAPLPVPPAPAPIVPVQTALGYYRSPYAGGLYPGFGYGGGLGFHKHFHLSKGFGFGSYF